MRDRDYRHRGYVRQGNDFSGEVVEKLGGSKSNMAHAQDHHEL
jgi:hypothetical protein